MAYKGKGVGNSLKRKENSEKKRESMKKLIIVGAGGFGRELLQWCKDANKVEKKWVITGFLDDNIDALDGYECEEKIIGTIHEWQPGDDELFAMAIANPAIKKEVAEKLEERGAKFTSIIHPTARIGNFTEIGKGVVLYPNAGVTVNVKVGDFVTILDNTSVGHDAMIGKYSTICASCGINGHVRVGEQVFIGCNVATIPNVRIGNQAHIGVGSVVVSNVRDGMHVFGNPAKRIALPKVTEK